MQIDYKSAAIDGAVAALVVGYLTWGLEGQKRFGASSTPLSPSSYEVAPLALPATASRDGQAVMLNRSWFQYIKVMPVGLHDSANHHEIVGNIDFNQDHAVQVFTSYRGKVRDTYAKVGGAMAKGKSLFDVDSPDLVQAESTLISITGTRKLTTAALARARQLSEIQGLAQKNLDRTISDQQAMEVVYRAARRTLTVFDKTPAQMGQIVETRKTDSLLTVVSPIPDQVTTRSVQPGLFLQSNNGTASFTVADVPTIWTQAFVPETDAPLLHVGQPAKTHVMVFPGRIFNGKITTVDASVDANAHHILVRPEINDPRHELRPDMFTSFDTTTGAPIQSSVLAMNGVVREGDGTMVAQVIMDRKRFVWRVIKLGLEQDDFVQVLKGLSAGELAASEGALYLNTATAGSLNGAD